MSDADRGANQAGKGINVVMVNSDSMDANPEEYIMCLVEYGEERTIRNPDNPPDDEPYDPTILEPIQDEVCDTPSPAPTTDPTIDPTTDPTTDPTKSPTTDPTKSPSTDPTRSPSTDPTRSPSTDPTKSPTTDPTKSPTTDPTKSPSTDPTRSPSTDPTKSPSTDPTKSPSTDPTRSPSTDPTKSPSTDPTKSPSTDPTRSPSTDPTASPSTDPTRSPSTDPTRSPSTDPTKSPSTDPTKSPSTDPTRSPSTDPTKSPSTDPTRSPSTDPTRSPSTDPTRSPSTDPTSSPSTDPTRSPSTDPTKSPSTDPTSSPSTDPTRSPSTDPTKSPSTDPTRSPSTDPTVSPSTDPTRSPSSDPTVSPSTDPTISPTTDPTHSPTTDPTRSPTTDPTSQPTESPFHGECYIGFELDVIFLIDQSCGLTLDECLEQMEGISELASSIKNDHTPRLGIIYFDDDSTFSDIALDDTFYNLPSIDDISVDLVRHIRTTHCADAWKHGTPDLQTAIEDAQNEFIRVDQLPYTHKKLVIFSNCMVDDAQKTDICNTWGGDNRMYVNNQEVEITIYNIDTGTDIDIDTYLDCLIDDDTDRLFAIENGEESRTEIQDTYKRFKAEICTQPTKNPTTDPTVSPSTDPTRSPSTDPTRSPTTDPTKSPSTDPTKSPSTDPTKSPSTDPTKSPSTDPTRSPSTDPTKSPSTDPTKSPSTDPTKSPSTDPTRSPSTDPTRSPSTDPTKSPSTDPTVSPSTDPTKSPSTDPTKSPSTDPTKSPSTDPTRSPSTDPTRSPSTDPTRSPSTDPTKSPSTDPTKSPSTDPTKSPSTDPTKSPSTDPTRSPSTDPTKSPSTDPTKSPSTDPTRSPSTDPTKSPSTDPTKSPSTDPTRSPSTDPTASPSTDPTRSPSTDPTRSPSTDPTKSPSTDPTRSPSTDPTKSPSTDPTRSPSTDPTRSPSTDPTRSPSTDPTKSPSTDPTESPSTDPTKSPSTDPTRSPSTDPTRSPSTDPTRSPSTDPTRSPSTDPTKSPSTDPTRSPSTDPTKSPSTDPTRSPSTDPTVSPSTDPTRSPSTDPTRSPSTDPTRSPSTDPTVSPSTDPTTSPTTDPTRSPTTDPTFKPTESPIHDGCEIGYELDVVFLVDQSCGMSSAVCINYLDGVFEYISSIKKYSQPRVAYIDIQSTNVDPLISLNATDYNDLNDMLKFLTTVDSMQQKVRGQDCYKEAWIIPDVVNAINKATAEFNDHSQPDRRKKIVIISNCKSNDDVCGTFPNEIYVQDTEVEVTVVNIANPTPANNQISNAEAATYLKCLTENDPTRLLSVPSTDPTDMESVVYDFWNEICEQPTEAPTTDPTTDPTQSPSTDPTRSPSTDPTRSPSTDPTRSPTTDPTKSPSTDPTHSPSTDPTKSPSTDPTKSPSTDPTKSPSTDPTRSPSTDPTKSPSTDPTQSPSTDPTRSPSTDPTVSPSTDPTTSPTTDPTKSPSTDPTKSPSTDPTKSPSTDPTRSPSTDPTRSPTTDPTTDPTRSPSTDPTKSPSTDPTKSPSTDPTKSPSTDPTRSPSTDPTASPSTDPTKSPSTDPTKSPSTDPTASPSTDPTASPSTDPTRSPSTDPTKSPSTDPTKSPSTDPTKSPSTDPTKSPSTDPTRSPSTDPTKSPSTDPTRSPSTDPTRSPSTDPTQSPSTDPTRSPSTDPTVNPTRFPTKSPTVLQCEYSGTCVDILILNDVDSSFEGKASKCRKHQDMVADTLTRLKGPYNGGAALPFSRVGYIEFDRNEAEIIVSLNAYPHNGNNDGVGGSSLVTDEQMMEYSNKIEGRCDDETDASVSVNVCNDATPTALYDALDLAEQQFNLYTQGTNAGRDRYLVIFSNCRVPQPERERICNDYEEYIRSGSRGADRGANQNGDGINVVMINMGEEFSDSEPDDYILCLTEYDDKRIYQTLSRNKENFDTEGLEATIVAEVCYTPSPAPTTDPTIDPTTDPTTDPTKSPSTDPTRSPSTDPTRSPSTDPTISPTTDPTKSPSTDPTKSPSTDPTKSPSTDPTKSPSTDPTKSPSTDPTKSPSTDPTISPTTDPTRSPSTDPTRSPTTDPTFKPTVSPLHEHCYIGFDLDFIFIVDDSCGYTEDECSVIMESIAEYQQLIKGNMSPRFGLIKMQDSSPLIEISLALSTYNDVTLLDPEDLFEPKRRALYQAIQESSCSSQQSATTDLAAAIEAAIGEFALNSEPNREEKIVIFSSCMDGPTIGGGDSDICASYQNGIFDGVSNAQNPLGNQIEVTVVNLGGTENANVADSTPGKYLKCLTDSDDGRFVEIPDATDLYSYQRTFEDFQLEICDEPTNSPTTDPTTDPTRSPSTDPTRSPSTDPTRSPSTDPTTSPSTDPTRSPSTDPTESPSTDPTRSPSTDPTRSPSTDPTRSPSTDPTRSPSTDPTRSPSTDPTRSPSTDPTQSPSTDPTRSPTTDPTVLPTKSPTRDSCPENDDIQIDIAIGVDTSCEMTENECRGQQYLVAETVTAIRGSSIRLVGKGLDVRTQFNQRVVYFEFGSNAELFNPFDQGKGSSFWDRYNSGDASHQIYTQQEADQITQQLYVDILARADIICTPTALASRSGSPNLDGFLDELTKSDGQFGKSQSTDRQQDREILIFNNCGVTDTKRISICNKYEEHIRNPVQTKDGRDIGYNVVMANYRPESQLATDPYYIDDTQTYIGCLVEYDTSDRIFPIDGFPNTDIIEDIQDSICKEPSPAPTTDPTIDPTRDPTRDPTTDPTRQPTPSPNMPACESKPTDIVFLVDSGCEGDAICNEKWEFIAELMTSIKGVSPNTNRVAVYQFDSVAVYEIITLTNTIYNDITNAEVQEDINAYYNVLAEQSCNGVNDGSDRELQDALDAAYAQFDEDEADSDDLGRDKKIVIFSSCFVPSTQAQTVCIENYDIIKTGETDENLQKRENHDKNGIDVMIVNLPSNSVTVPTNYLLCLAEYDTDRIFQSPSLAYDDTKGLVSPISDQICSDPSPAPTTDPTIDPTRDPTTDPTTDPTKSPTTDPTKSPSTDPTKSPSTDPTKSPSTDPTRSPSTDPTKSPSTDPTKSPSTDPTRSPSTDPTKSPSTDPTTSPTTDPTRSPSTDPTTSPTTDPTKSPSTDPTRSPSTDPTKSPTSDPTVSPSTDPTVSPSTDPTISPTTDPTRSPSTDPTRSPSTDPTASPSTDPTISPSTDPTRSPSTDPTTSPTTDPTKSPSTDPTRSPTTDPTSKPTRSPIVCDCGAGYNMDLTFLIDISCIPESECNAYTEGIAELFSAIKGEFALPRISVATFDGSHVDEKVALNNSDYNDFMTRGSYYIGLDKKTAFYNAIRDIECNGNGNSGEESADKSTNVLSAIEAAFDAFDYEETVYLPDMTAIYGGGRYFFTGRDKKIVLFSTCLNTESLGDKFGEDAVCTYSDEESRIIQGGEVEITIFNALTTTSNLMPETYFCLTEDDVGRQYYAGRGSRGGLTLSAISEMIDRFKREICDEPTIAPTTDPTPSPTDPPTTDPTDFPSNQPSTDPTPTPTSPPSQACTCDNLGYQLTYQHDDCGYSPCHGCIPDGPCSYMQNCFTYKIEITSNYITHNDDCIPHQPEHIIIPPRDDCPVAMNKWEYWGVLYQVTYENGISPNPLWEEIYDEDGPDPLAGIGGIKIPIIFDAYSNSFIFNLCLLGVTNFIPKEDINIGWTYDSNGYGYNCQSTTKIPDLCEDRVAYNYARTENNYQREIDNRGVDLLKPGNNKNDATNDKKPNANTSSYGIFALYTTYSQWIFIAIMAIFSLNVFVCAYIKCIRGKNKNNNKQSKYGFIGKNDESDDSDGTDSEIDSDESDEQLIE